MRRTTSSSSRLGLLLAGTLLAAPAARAQPSAPAAPGEESITRCGDKLVGEGAGQLRPLGHGFYADGDRVRRGCTLLLQRPSRRRPPLPFVPSSFRPLGCGYVRYATSIYWYKPQIGRAHV